jgi:aryl-alcohol dehydrogenase-like predicted oxidoreductase
MQFATLGRTQLKVSVLGLGGGGLSRFGLAQGGSTEDAVRLVQHGLDRGINFIDLGGAIYGTDEIVARALGLNKCRSEVFFPPRLIWVRRRGPSRVAASHQNYRRV